MKIPTAGKERATIIWIWVHLDLPDNVDAIAPEERIDQARALVVLSYL
jgi:hypothetical protein